VDKTELRFFKIDDAGFLYKGGDDGGGYWAVDAMVERNNSYMIEIPPTLKPGFYVLRHELVALHYANKPDGAQAYPQCFNIEVLGNGTEMYEGIPATELYPDALESNSFFVDIWADGGLDSYDIPGPPVVEGAVHVEPMSQSYATIRGTPVILDGTTVVQMTITPPDMLTVTGTKSGSRTPMVMAEPVAT